MSSSDSNRLIFVSKRKFADLSTRTFNFKIRGKIFQGFVVKKAGKFFAYLNRCKHLAVTLDLADNRFFTHDQSALQCHMHGAIYEIETGLCVGGPCVGASLTPLALEEEEEDLVIQVPDEIE